MLREAAALNAQMDRLTGVYNRETMLSMMFRETDRVQRMKSSLCVILFDIDDFGHWNLAAGPGGLRRVALPGGGAHRAPAAQLRPAGPRRQG